MADRAAPAAHAVAGPPPARSMVLAAYAAIYVVWGSTYLAIRFAIETLPPFLMAGTRFLIAGALLYLWARLRGASRPTAANWKGGAIVGAFLLLGGNGGVVWAEQRVPSSIAALLVAILPLWMVVLERIGPERKRPTARTVVGVMLGFLGVAVLVGPGALQGDGNVDLVGSIVLVLASLSWAIGSLYSRRAQLPAAPTLGSGIQMLSGGALLAVAGLLTGEVAEVAVSQVSATSLAAVAYLIVFGSIVGFSAFVWLLRVEPPSRVATYAYVNPVVAVALGWLFAGERMTVPTMFAAAIIVAAVALIVTGPRPVERGTTAPSLAPATAPRWRRRPARAAAESGEA